MRVWPVLSRQPLKADEILVSNMDDPMDYHHTRRVAVAHTSVDGKEIAVASVHLSWWDKGFQFEWPRIENYFSQVGKPFILAGDFNNPAGQEGYETILSSSLSFKIALSKPKKQRDLYCRPWNRWLDGQSSSIANRLRLCKSRMGHPASTCHF